MSGSALIWIITATTLMAHPDHDSDNSSNARLFNIASGNLINKVTITEEEPYRIIQSNGIPNHQTGRFPSRDNPNTISEQSLTFRIPLHPQNGNSFTEVPQGKFGVAVNGIPFDPGTAEYWNQDRNWHIEAIQNGKGELGIDSSNAHVQPNGTYHYHGIPWGLVNALERNTGSGQPLLVGWAADGYPIYYQKGVRSSYQLKKEKREGGSEGPGGRPDGTYTSDYEFVEGHGDLDEANGKEGVTPEFPNGTYHYCLTDEFPYVPRKWKGKPGQGFSGPGAEGGGPGGGRPPFPPPGGPGQHPPRPM